MRIMIVEDEFLLAMDLEDLIITLGHQVVGPVASFNQAKDLASEAEIALVDVRLTDGVTGPDIADLLTTHYGVTVVFMTANPEAVSTSASAIGVIAKPYEREHIASAIAFATAHREGRPAIKPQRLILLPRAAVLG